MSAQNTPRNVDDDARGESKEHYGNPRPTRCNGVGGDEGEGVVVAKLGSLVTLFHRNHLRSSLAEVRDDDGVYPRLDAGEDNLAIGISNPFQWIGVEGDRCPLDWIPVGINDLNPNDILLEGEASFLSFFECFLIDRDRLLLNNGRFGIDLGVGKWRARGRDRLVRVLILLVARGTRGRGAV